jgi:hypothetical protein
MQRLSIQFHDGQFYTEENLYVAFIQFNIIIAYVKWN